MADEVSSGTIVQSPQPGALGGPGVHETNHGRPASWVAVTIIMVAFVAGGLALMLGPVWWLFWASAGLTVVGGLLGLGAHILDDWY
jgi:hypothetical protein